MTETDLANTKIQEQLLSEFCTLNGSSFGDALHFLSSTKWDLSSAVAKYSRAQEEFKILKETQEEEFQLRDHEPCTGPSVLYHPYDSSLVGKSSTRLSDTAEGKSDHSHPPSIYNSVIMRHLCEKCSNLRVSDESEAGKQSQRLLETVSKPSYENVEYLAQSAQGRTDKACHLCALILRSLKGHKYIGTIEEETCLPNGPIILSLSEKGDLSIIATCGAVVGYPIQLSLGMDESCRGSEVSSSASSDQIFAQIQSWSHDCVNKHSRCSIARSSVSWLPSRVVDLGSPSGPMSPKIAETRGAVGSYVTLTHRWTKLTELSATTTANYDSRKLDLDMRSLSQTFQDAFEAAHRLGVQYLWIDALCIIQDSSEDWAREASNMRSIYEFSWLNIAVAGSEREDSRIFMERVSRLSRPCKMPDSLLSGHIADFEGPVYAYLSSQCFARAVFDGFLTRRGWILQERILSPRTVYFGAEEVFWECSSISASETIPWGWEEHDSPIVKFNAYDLALNTSSFLETDSSITQNVSGRARKIKGVLGEYRSDEVLSPLYRYWYHLVEAYTQKDLTKTDDRLPAIFGLAQALHKSGMPYEIFAECYQNGVWLSEPTSLLWHLNDSPKADKVVNTTAPTYSWGGWSNPAVFLVHDVEFLDRSKPGSESIDEATIESLGGHPSLQLAQISIPSNTYILRRQKVSKTANILQITGQLEMAIINIDTSNSRTHFTAKRQKLLEQSTPIVSISNRNGMDQLHSTLTLLDKYPENALEDWLRLSEGTVWLLKIAIGKLYGESCPYSRWLLNNEMGFVDSSNKLYDFGLILIPSHEDLLAVKEIQEKLEPWNLPAFSNSILEGRSSPPPMNKETTHMYAQNRLEIHQLMGPHNTTFRRVGIYRTQASSYKHFNELKTTLLLV